MSKFTKTIALLVSYGILIALWTWVFWFVLAEVHFVLADRLEKLIFTSLWVIGLVGFATTWAELILDNNLHNG